MATNSKIGIELENGKVRAITCNWDGHYQTVGKILYEHYQDKAKIEKLIALGSLSYLEKEVDIPEGVIHNFNKPHPDITVAYHRDRAQKFHDMIFESKEDFLGGLRYLYTLEGVWVVESVFEGIRTLEDVLREEGIIQ